MKTPNKTKFYKWQGIAKTGETVYGSLQAKNKHYAKIYLLNQNIKPFKIKKQYPFFLEKIKGIDIALFLKQLSTLIHAGIPIVHACYTLEKSQKNLSLQHLIYSIRTQIESGKHFSDQLYQFPLYFENYVCHLIRLGEHSGNLENTLLRAANYKENAIALKNKIKQALFYPIMVAFISIFITFTMLVFIVPRFTELFESTHQALPLMTRCIITLSNFIRYDYWFFITPILVASIFYYYTYRSIPIKNKLDIIIFKIPVFGTLASKIILTRFARNLATAFAAGLTLVEGLILLESLSKNRVYIQTLQQLKRHVTCGLQLHVAMHSSSFFPILMLQMVKVGEESGKLETMLENIAILYEQDIDYFIHNLRQLLEPLIILVLGVVIGGIVIALYLPIFKLGTVI